MRASILILCSLVCSMLANIVFDKIFSFDDIIERIVVSVFGSLAGVLLALAIITLAAKL